MVGITVVLPYTPYAVPDRGNRRLNMTPNGRQRRRFPDTQARVQMRADAFNLTRVALQSGDSGAFVSESELVFSVVCRTTSTRRRDDDNLVAGLKWARDGIAQALGVDDSVFRVSTPVFEQAAVEETQIVISRVQPT